MILSAGRFEIFLPLFLQTHLKQTARRSVPTLDLSNLGRAVLPYRAEGDSEANNNRSQGFTP